MRNPWRLLLLRSYSRSPIQISTTFSHLQVQSSPYYNTFRSFASLLHNNTFDATLDSRISNYTSTRNCSSTTTSSEVDVVEQNDVDHVVVTDIFTKESDFDEIKKGFELNNLVVSHEFVLKILGSPDLSPDVARRFFDWVLKVESERLSSKTYNLMLGILGVNGFVEDFWNLFETMKKKGYGVSKWVSVKVLEKFEKEGLVSDAEKLAGVFALGSVDNSAEKISSRLCKIIRNEVWSDDVEARIGELNVTFSSDLVKLVLENIATEPTKGFLFFRWVEESGLFKHDEKTYNAMLTVFGREDCIDRFFKVADEMRGAGWEMEMETYVKVFERFIKRKMVKDAVDLYEFAMLGAHKPSVQDCTLLLKKIVVSKDFDMNLFSQVVRIYTAGGNFLTNSMLYAVLKSLSSVGRFRESSKILKAMEEGGLVAKSTLQSKIAFGISRAGENDEVSNFTTNMEAVSTPNIKTWASLIEGYCVAGDLDNASDYFQKMVEREGISCAGHALDLLVNAFCSKKRAIDVAKLLSDMVREKDIKPWHTTYKTLISRLVSQGGFKKALDLLGLMKNHGFPPYLDPFIKYISKTGTGDDAILFLKAMTVNRFPSTPVFLRLFEAFFKARRHNEAQDFLSMCPGYIRNHADVLNLFCTMKSVEAASATAVVA